MEMAKVKEVKLENDSGLFGIGGDAKKALQEATEMVDMLISKANEKSQDSINDFIKIFKPAVQ